MAKKSITTKAATKSTTTTVKKQNKKSTNENVVVKPVSQQELKTVVEEKNSQQQKEVSSSLSEIELNIKKLSNFRKNIQKEIGKLYILMKQSKEVPQWWKKKSATCEEYISSQAFLEELKEFGKANYELYQFQKDTQKDFKNLSEQQKKNFLKLKHNKEIHFKNSLLCLKDMPFQSRIEAEYNKINNKFNRKKIDFRLLKSYYYFFEEVERMINFFRGNSIKEDDPLKEEKLLILKEIFLENFGVGSIEEYLKKNLQLPKKPPQIPKRKFNDWRDEL